MTNWKRSRSSGWATETKKALTPQEVLAVAQAALNGGAHQHVLAGVFAVDSGRIAEAVVAMKWAAENHKTIYRHVQHLKGNGKSKVEDKAEPVEERHDDILRLALPHSDPLHPDNRGFDGPGGAE